MSSRIVMVIPIGKHVWFVALQVIGISVARIDVSWYCSGRVGCLRPALKKLSLIRSPRPRGVASHLPYMIGLQDQCKSTSKLSWPNRMGH